MRGVGSTLLVFKMGEVMVRPAEVPDSIRVMIEFPDPAGVVVEVLGEMEGRFHLEAFREEVGGDLPTVPRVG